VSAAATAGGAAREQAAALAALAAGACCFAAGAATLGLALAPTAAAPAVAGDHVSALPETTEEGGVARAAPVVGGAPAARAAVSGHDQTSSTLSGRVGPVFRAELEARLVVG
jgi:hypothetical protein